MKVLRSLLLLSVVLMSTVSIQAGGFLDSSRPEKLFNLGVRFGINTTNRNVDKAIFNEWNVNSWGTGIDAGVIADLNIRDYISLQPGFFYESRSGKYAYVYSYDSDMFSQYGQVRSYNFTIPILAALHFNVAPQVRWNVEIGPYVQLFLKNSKGNGFSYIDPDTATTAHPDTDVAKASNFDFGFKFGTSLTIRRHYTVGVHYLAGWLDAWKEDELGGRNKAWVFSIGYDF